MLDFVASLGQKKSSGATGDVGCALMNTRFAYTDFLETDLRSETPNKPSRVARCSPFMPTRKK